MTDSAPQDTDLEPLRIQLTAVHNAAATNHVDEIKPAVDGLIVEAGRLMATFGAEAARGAMNPILAEATRAAERVGTNYANRTVRQAMGDWSPTRH